MLRREKENNERLAECLSSVQKEIDERAPILQQQREDYEKTIAENEELASNLSLVSKECENQKSEIESKDKKLASVKREYDILKQENEDLSRQIVAIMVEQHGIGESGEFEYSASTDSEAVINEKLVIAKNVEELHQQNKKLLMVVRELTAKQEELENELEASKDNTTAEELMEARQVIEGLQESQRNFENRIDACLKERDMWKRMAEKGGATENVIQLQKVIDPTINSELEIKYRELQKDFDIYRKEMETNQEILNNNLENARKNVSDIRTTLAKKESQIDYIKEQNLLNKTECEKLRSEASSLREQNSHLSGIITAHEQNISEMTNQLAGLKEENKNLTFKYGTLQQEKEAMSMLTERLKNENRDLSEQKTKMDSLMDSIHNLQTCMDMNQFEGRKRLVANNKKLEEELDDYKKKLETQQQETKEVIAKKEKDLEILSSKYNTLLQDHHAIREKMIVSDTSINDLNRKVEEMTQELKEKADIIQKSGVSNEGASNTEISVARTEDTTEGEITQTEIDVQSEQQENDAFKIKELQAELNSVKAQLEATIRHKEQFQEISKTSEESLSNLTQTYNKYKNDTDKTIREMKEQLESNQRYIEDIEKQIETKTKAFEALESKAEKDKAFYQEEKASMEERIKTLEICEKEIMTIREDHMADMAKQKELIEEAHSNYQKELLNHSKDIEALYKVKDELKALEGEIDQYKAKATNATLNLKKNELVWNKEKETMKDTIQRLETRCEDLDKQNNILQEQYIQLNQQVHRIKELEKDIEEQVGSESQNNSSQSSILNTSAEKKINDLNEVIVFLRNEKEIAKCEKDVLEQQTINMKQQIDDLNATLDRTKILLSEERKNKSSEYEKFKKDNEMLLEKVGQLNVYLESNERLREQNKLGEEKLQQLKNEKEDLVKKMEPLNQEIRNVKAELGVKNKEIEALETDNKKWKTRVNTILAKYERIDPIEYKQVKEDNERLLKEKQVLEAQQQKLVQLEKDIVTRTTECDNLKVKVNDLSTKQTKLGEVVKSQRTLIDNQKKEMMKKEEEHKRVIKELNEKHRQELENEKATQEKKYNLRLSILEKKRNSVSNAAGKPNTTATTAAGHRPAPNRLNTVQRTNSTGNASAKSTGNKPSPISPIVPPHPSGKIINTGVRNNSNLNASNKPTNATQNQNNEKATPVNANKKMVSSPVTQSQKPVAKTPSQPQTPQTPQSPHTPQTPSSQSQQSKPAIQAKPSPSQSSLPQQHQQSTSQSSSSQSIIQKQQQKPVQLQRTGSQTQASTTNASNSNPNIVKIPNHKSQTSSPVQQKPSQPQQTQQTTSQQQQQQQQQRQQTSNLAQNTNTPSNPTTKPVSTTIPVVQRRPSADNKSTINVTRPTNVTATTNKTNSPAQAKSTVSPITNKPQLQKANSGTNITVNKPSTPGTTTPITTATKTNTNSISTTTTTTINQASSSPAVVTAQKPAQSAQSAQSTQSTQSAQPAQSAQSAQPAQSTQSAQTRPTTSAKTQQQLQQQQHLLELRKKLLLSSHKNANKNHQAKTPVKTPSTPQSGAQTPTTSQQQQQQQKPLSQQKPSTPSNAETATTNASNKRVNESSNVQENEQPSKIIKTSNSTSSINATPNASLSSSASSINLSVANTNDTINVSDSQANTMTAASSITDLSSLAANESSSVSTTMDSSTNDANKGNATIATTAATATTTTNTSTNSNNQAIETPKTQSNEPISIVQTSTSTPPNTNSNDTGSPEQNNTSSPTSN